MANKKISTKEFFLRREIAREAKRVGITEEVKDLAWLNLIKRDTEWWRRWEAISALVTESLVRDGLWKSDHDKKTAPFENGMPALAKGRAYAAETSATNQEDIYEREKADDIYKNAEIAEDFFETEEVEEFFDEKLDATSSTEADLERGESLHLYLPRRARSALDALLRRYPRNLKESLARDLVESGRIASLKPWDLVPALCFYEVGTEDAETFEHVRADAYLECPFHQSGKEFDFPEYKRDLLRLFHLLKNERRRYFLGNRFLRNAIEKAKQNPDLLLPTLWERFLTAKGSLTRKQWHALKQVRVKRRNQTDVARKLRLSLDSLRDRLEGAELKFRKLCPELATFSPSKTHVNSRTASYSDSGLLDKRAAKKVLPLYRIDPKTGERTKIPLRKGPKGRRPGVNAAEIKAWAVESTPVPDLSFTDFFGGLLPEGHLTRMMSRPSLHDKRPRGISFEEKVAKRVLLNTSDEEQAKTVARVRAGDIPGVQ